MEGSAVFVGRVVELARLWVVVGGAARLLLVLGDAGVGKTGFVAEGMRRLAPTDEAKRAIERRIPLRRFGTKDELADLALFLCSDAARYITGAVYYCDGGASLCPTEFSVPARST